MLPEDPQPQPEATSFFSRRYCAVFGALVFTFCFVLVLIGVVLNCFAKLGLGEAIGMGKPFVNMLYTGTPIVALMGAVIGFEAHRLATGARKPFPSQWYLWVIAFFFISPLTLFFLPSSRLRRRLIVEGKQPSGFWPVCYGLLLIGAVLIPLSPSRQSELFYLYAGLATFVVLFLADSLVINRIALWNQQQRLSVVGGQKVQFSLSTLFLGSLLIGAYISGLVLILRS